MELLEQSKPMLFLTATAGDAASLKLRQFNAERCDPSDDMNGALVHYSAHDIYLLPNQSSAVEFAQLAARLISLGNSVFVAPVGTDTATLTAESFSRLALPPVVEKRARGPGKGAPSEDARERWKELGLFIAGNGQPLPNIDNAYRALESSDVQIWYDEFLKLAMFAHDCEPREFEKSDFVALTVWMQRELELRTIGLKTVTSACELFMWQHRRNCAQDWVASLKHDGIPRLDRLAADGFGTPDDDYHAKVMKCFIQGLVLRIQSPGAQVDLLPVLEGPQGIRKSSALRLLGGKWFAEYHGDLWNIKAFQECLRGKMLIEFAELASMGNSDRELLDGIVTNRVDTFRKSYGTDSKDFPRMCCLAGTTNESHWNRSAVGARRYPPVECGAINTDWIAANREQLFAEAAARLAAGESHYDIPDFKARVDLRRAGDAWEDAIARWLDGRRDTTVEQIMDSCLEIEKARATNYDAKRIRTCLSVLGWKNMTIWVDGKARNGWRAPGYAEKRLAEIKAESTPVVLADEPPVTDEPRMAFDDIFDPSTPF